MTAATFINNRQQNQAGIIAVRYRRPLKAFCYLFAFLTLIGSSAVIVAYSRDDQQAKTTSSSLSSIVPKPATDSDKSDSRKTIDSSNSAVDNNNHQFHAESSGVQTPLAPSAGYHQTELRQQPAWGGPNGLSCLVCSSMHSRECLNISKTLLPPRPPLQSSQIETTTAISSSSMLLASQVGFHNQSSKVDIATNSYVPSRACVDDEFFCSTVIIERPLFVGNKLESQLWAVERNCTKSCNHGCMAIGERIRLKICSRCYRTANCNDSSAAMHGA